MYVVVIMILPADIDECGLGTDNCSKQTETCLNTVGSYLCLCLEGYSRQNGVCKGTVIYST